MGQHAGGRSRRVIASAAAAAVAATILAVAPASADGSAPAYGPTDDAGAPLGPAEPPTVQAETALAPPVTPSPFPTAPGVVLPGQTAPNPVSLTPQNTNWSATSLGLSTSWSVSEQTGSFSWTYPFSLPPSPAGGAPSLALQYSSASVDGRVANANNQTSWVGEGWDLSAGFIERSYQPCTEDGQGTSDLCWGSDNATISFGSSSGPLVKDSATGQWHLREDDGTRVEHLVEGSGAQAKDYWKLTTPDGTQVFFGRGQRPTDTVALGSQWTVSVFGDDAGEPCNTGTFSTSSCQQPWRWNVDYVVDPSGNTTTYFYDTEVNYYTRAGGVLVPYVRGGYLNHIDYGQVAGAETSSPAPARVDFTVAERCLAADCSNLTAATATSWPDVPQAYLCGPTGTCPVSSPTFFTRKRLTQVSTSIYGAGGQYSSSGYSAVDRWDLTQVFKDPGDNSTAVPNILWLSSIRRTGDAGSRADVALNAVSFEGVALPNRANDYIGDGFSPMNRFRMSYITNEAGGKTAISYTRDCSGAMPPVDANATGCMPVVWFPPGSSKARTEFFYKYLVSTVSTWGGAGNPSVETAYSYLDGAVWLRDLSALLPDSQRTWNDFRGYGRVRVTTGSAADPDRPRLVSEARYFRGTGGTLDGIPDVDILNGTQRQSTQFNGAAPVTDTWTTPWVSAATANDGVRTAHHLGVASTTTRVYGTQLPGGYRDTRTDTSYDALGYPTQIDDLGDVSTAADDRCTRLEYVRNGTANILGTVSRAETVSVACATSPTRPGDVISDARTRYDGLAEGAVPVRGLVTGTGRVVSYTGSTPNVTLWDVRTAYDSRGRVTTVTDALLRTVTTAYTTTGSGLVTGTRVTSPDPDGSGPLTALVATTTLDPAWGSAVSSTDPNGKVSTATLDAGSGHRRLAARRPRRRAPERPVLLHRRHSGHDDRDPHRRGRLPALHVDHRRSGAVAPDPERERECRCPGKGRHRHLLRHPRSGSADERRLVHGRGSRHHHPTERHGLPGFHSLRLRRRGPQDRGHHPCCGPGEVAHHHHV